MSYKWGSHCIIHFFIASLVDIHKTFTLGLQLIHEWYTHRQKLTNMWHTQFSMIYQWVYTQYNFYENIERKGTNRFQLHLNLIALAWNFVVTKFQLSYFFFDWLLWVTSLDLSFRFVQNKSWLHKNLETSFCFEKLVKFDRSSLLEV